MVTMCPNQIHVIGLVVFCQLNSVIIQTLFSQKLYLFLREVGKLGNFLLVAGMGLIRGQTETSKQPIRTCYLGHVTGNQPIRDQYFLIRSVPVATNKLTSLLNAKPVIAALSEWSSLYLLCRAGKITTLYHPPYLKRGGAVGGGTFGKGWSMSELQLGLGVMVGVGYTKSRNRPKQVNNRQPIITCYLGHLTSYQPIRDQYFLIRSVLGVL
eukprot:sb/3470195/